MQSGTCYLDCHALFTKCRKSNDAIQYIAVPGVLNHTGPITASLTYNKTFTIQLYDKYCQNILTPFPITDKHTDANTCMHECILFTLIIMVLE